MENKQKYATHKREPFFEIAKAHINTEDIVLDIGAGEGVFADFCQKEDMYLYDGNKDSIKKLQERYKNCFYGTLPQLPFNDSFFDLIHCSHVVEHLQPQDFYDTLKEMDRCLKGNGKLVISAPLLWSGFYDDLSHVKPYNPNIYIKYLTKRGGANLTRKMISNKYTVESLTYRYKEIFYTEDFNFIKNRLLFKIIQKLINLSYRVGYRRYEKSGYTIVLSKSK